MLTNENIINNIREWFKQSGSKTAVINVSGGADSTYVAWCLVKALGKENVYGLIQPNGKQKDIDDALEVVNTLGISFSVINIETIYKTMVSNMKSNNKDMLINLAPRIRMTLAYAQANAINGRVIGTGNASERYVGYFTKWGDGACDFNPIKDICKTDLIKMGLELGIPEHLIKKTPADGLTDKTDEEKYGFTYEVLDNYIKTGVCEDWKIKEKIDRMHKNSRHKFEEI